MDIRLRTARQEDTDFVFRVEREAIRDYAIATWGEWHEAASRARAEANILAGLIQVIEAAQVPVGILRADRTASGIELHQIYLLPEFQRRGIGTHLLGALIGEARTSGLPVTLRVLKVNPAVQLYKRVGFVVTGQSQDHLYLAYTP